MNVSETAAVPWTPAAALRAALAVAAVVVFFGGIDNYASWYWSGPAPIVLVWAFVAAAGVLGVLRLGGGIGFLGSPVLLWTLAFFLVTTAWSAFTPASAAQSQAVRTAYRSIGLLAAFVVIFDDPRARRIAAFAVAGAVVFAALLNVAELFELVRFTGQEDVRVAGRSGGLYVNANVSGLAIVFGLAVTVHLLPRSWRIPLLVLGAAGIAATFSRGAAISLVALVPVLVWRGHIRLWQAALVAALVGILMMSRGHEFVRFLDQTGVLTTDTAARLDLEQDDSGRVGLAKDAWRGFIESPVFGRGLGATTEAHNEFLALAGDHGVIGLLLFPLLALALVLANPGAFPFALVLMVAGFFSHNLLDDRTSLLAIALAASSGRRRAAPAAREEERSLLDPGEPSLARSP